MAHTRSSISRPAKSRRPHTKSRNGCFECKHRHIRCDENKPICTNCEASERTCSFLTPQTGKIKQKQGQQPRPKQQQPQAATTLPGFEMSDSNNVTSIETVNEGHAQHLAPIIHQQINELVPHEIPSPASLMQLSVAPTPPAGCYPAFSVVSDVASKPMFTPQHMILLHHADRVPNLTAPKRSILDIAVRYIIGAPYLMDEVLAFTAFHMAHLYPGSAVDLRHLATELQTRALASFNHFTKEATIDDKTTVPRFLFSAILGRHVLAESLTHCESDFDFFIEGFVECINLNRSIIAVTPPEAWKQSNNTEIQPFLDVVRLAQEKIVSPGSECDPLTRLMNKSDLNDANIKACRQAIEILQLSFDICQNLDEDDYTQSVSVFSVRVEFGFLELLRKHQPEALVILAFYGVLLYRCRNFWAFGDAGASMIRTIAGRLGSYWHEALAWPLHVIETDHN